MIVRLTVRWFIDQLEDVCWREGSEPRGQGQGGVLHGQGNDRLHEEGKLHVHCECLYSTRHAL